MFLRIARIAPASGIIFALLVIVASILTDGTPDLDASDSSWTSYYADAGNRHQEQVSFFLVGLAGLFFLQFLGTVRGALKRSEGEPARITSAAIASGTAFIALAISAHAVGTAVTWTVSAYGDDYTVDPDTARILASLAYVTFVMSLFAAAGMALAVATAAFQFKALPAWLAWLSALAALAGVLGILFIPSLVVLAWIVVLSAYLLVHATRAAPASASTPTPA